MAGGSLQKENPSDQQCGECLRWYHWRGISEHEKDCDGEDESPDKSDLWDPLPGTDRVPAFDGGWSSETDPEPESNHTESDTELMTETTDTTDTESETDPEPDKICPHCGARRNIIPTDRAIRRYRRADRLTTQIEAQLRRFDWYHDNNRCKGMWSA